MQGTYFFKLLIVGGDDMDVDDVSPTSSDSTGSKVNIKTDDIEHLERNEFC